MTQKPPPAVANNLIKRSKHPIRYNHQFDKAVLASINAQIAVMDKSGLLLTVNKAWEDFVQLKEPTPISSALQGENFIDICRHTQPSLHTISAQLLAGIYTVFHKEKPFFELEYSCQFTNGLRWFTFYVSKLEKDNTKIIITHQDISSRKLSEKKILHTNRLYTFISQVNQTIVHTTTEQDLFEKICKIAIEYGRFTGAWIALADKQNRMLNRQASSGIPELDSVAIKENAYLPGGPIDNVLNGLDYYVDKDIRKESHHQFDRYILTSDTRSGICLPIKKGGNVIGVFTIYSAEPDFFTKDEIKLLREAAFDVSFALDVFEKGKQKMIAEDKLRSSQLQLKQAEAIAHFGSWEFNFITDTSLWSDEALKIYGFTNNNQQSYESWLSAIHPEDFARVMYATGEGEAGSGNAAFFYRIIRTDGTIKHLYCQAKFQYAPDGKTIALQGVDHDITEIKETAESLLISQSNFTAIIENTDAAVYSLDTNFNYTAFNHLYQQTIKLNYGVDIKNGDKVYDLNRQKDLIELFKSEQQYKRVLNGETVKFEKELKSNGQYSCTSISMHPIWKDKKVVGLSCFNTDITKQKQEQFQKEKITADLISRNKDLEQFSYIISHNLRAPVANIMSLASLISSEEIFDDEKKLLINGLNTSAEKLDEVIRDLNYILQVRVQASEQKTIVNFSELVKNIEVSIQFMLDEQDAVIKTDFSQINELLTIKSFMHSIFYNLISNSIKYRRIDVPLSIEIESKLLRNSVELYFKDNGMGIDLYKKSNQVFGLYKRFHTDKAEGKGIGLYMVKTQVEAIGGRVSVASEVNKGTTFKIVLDMS